MEKVQSTLPTPPKSVLISEVSKLVYNKQLFFCLKGDKSREKFDVCYYFRTNSEMTFHLIISKFVSVIAPDLNPSIYRPIKVEPRSSREMEMLFCYKTDYTVGSVSKQHFFEPWISSASKMKTLNLKFTGLLSMTALLLIAQHKLHAN